MNSFSVVAHGPEEHGPAVCHLAHEDHTRHTCGEGLVISPAILLLPEEYITRHRALYLCEENVRIR